MDITIKLQMGIDCFYEGPGGNAAIQDMQVIIAALAQLEALLGDQASSIEGVKVVFEAIGPAHYRFPTFTAMFRGSDHVAIYTLNESSPLSDEKAITIAEGLYAKIENEAVALAKELQPQMDMLATLGNNRHLLEFPEKATHSEGSAVCRTLEFISLKAASK